MIVGPRERSHESATRLVQFDFLRATEMAAVSCIRWIGKGSKEAADAAACDAIREVFSRIEMRGEIIIGEGVKDDAPGLFAGERVGSWAEDAPRIDVAIDPLDGTTNLSKGLPNSISCIAVAARQDDAVPALKYVPAFYMKKLAYPPQVRSAWMKDPSLPLDVRAPLSDVIRLTARILDKPVHDVVVMVLDRPRNAATIEEVRATGASLRMIGDGDITAALAPAIPSSGIDLYAGVGGAPEGILAAVGLRCVGGGMQTQVWPRDQAERDALAASGWSDGVEQVYRSRDLVDGEDTVFIATGISDSPLLRGVRVRGATVVTHSVLMRQQTQTIRFVETEHQLAERRTHLSIPAAPVGAGRRTSSASHSSPRDATSRLRRDQGSAALSAKSSRGTDHLPAAVLLFGPPGCGKGTVGKALGRIPGFTHCSSGDVIRAAMSRSGDDARWKAIAAGGLISDGDLWELFDLYLAGEAPRISTTETLVVDGIPRNRGQVPELGKRLDVRGVVYLECRDAATLVRRLRRRSTTEGRADDADEEIVQRRLRLFFDEGLPLLDEYDPDLVHVIDADQPPVQVITEVLNRVSRLK